MNIRIPVDASWWSRLFCFLAIILFVPAVVAAIVIGIVVAVQADLQGQYDKHNEAIGFYLNTSEKVPNQWLEVPVLDRTMRDKNRYQVFCINETKFGMLHFYVMSAGLDSKYGKEKGWLGEVDYDHDNKIYKYTFDKPFSKVEDAKTRRKIEWVSFKNDYQSIFGKEFDESNRSKQSKEIKNTVDKAVDKVEKVLEYNWEKFIDIP